MDPRRQQLLERIKRARVRRPCRFGIELKRDIIAYAESQNDGGIPIRQIASELALTEAALGAWLRHARRMRAAGRQPFERERQIELVAALLPQAQPDKTPPASPAGRKRGRRGARRKGELWLVVRAEHVYMTSIKPNKLVRLLDRSTDGTAGSA